MTEKKKFYREVTEMDEEFEKVIKKIFSSDRGGYEDALSEKIDSLVNDELPENDELSQDELFFVAAAGKAPQYESFEKFLRSRK